MQHGAVQVTDWLQLLVSDVPQMVVGMQGLLGVQHVLFTAVHVTCPPQPLLTLAPQSWPLQAVVLGVQQPPSATQVIC